MSRQWAQKKSGSNSSMSVQTSSSSQRPFTAPVYDPAAPKQTPSVQAKRRNVDWNRVTVEAQSPAGVQAKLSVGAPGDKYEQEADAMANKVMTMPAPENEKPLQREMAPEEKEEEVQTKPLANSIQREMVPEEKEEEVQTKPATEGKSQAGSNLESQLSGTKGGGSALSDEVRSHMEPRFGADFSSVRVHTDSAAVQMNRDLGAQAFTHGSDIYYGGGKSPGKDELTAHELTHVVQQNGSAVQRKPQEQAKLIQPLKEAVLQRAPGTETSATEQEVKEGEVYLSDKNNQLVVKDGTEELVFNNSEKFRIAAGTKIKYKKFNVNKYLTKAEIIQAGERPAAKDLGGEIAKTNQQRTEEVRKNKLINLEFPVTLSGKLFSSGARKHYKDTNAVARSDEDVKKLIFSNLNNVEITEVERTKDTFKINLGGINSIVGDIEYINNEKKSVSKINVFHVGPSLA